eukprot:TRINITY_DN423_c0_g2_i8.p3 TRINITY_DN423_c0_g2~~TRINITY_DN423_c0_g2_i8.p3  ORF type:complete len:144 (+),score=3.17 TRINITY_DN423_c0_g2_i8:1176-1607(+)
MCVVSVYNIHIFIFQQGVKNWLYLGLYIFFVQKILYLLLEEIEYTIKKGVMCVCGVVTNNIREIERIMDILISSSIYLVVYCTYCTVVLAADLFNVDVFVSKAVYNLFNQLWFFKELQNVLGSQGVVKNIVCSWQVFDNYNLS